MFSSNPVLFWPCARKLTKDSFNYNLVPINRLKSHWINFRWFFNQSWASSCRDCCACDRQIWSTMSHKTFCHQHHHYPQQHDQWSFDQHHHHDQPGLVFMMTSCFGLFYCYSTSKHFVRHAEAVLEKECHPLHHLQLHLHHHLPDDCQCQHHISSNISSFFLIFYDCSVIDFLDLSQMTEQHNL